MRGREEIKNKLWDTLSAKESNQWESIWKKKNYFASAHKPKQKGIHCTLSSFSSETISLQFLSQSHFAFAFYPAVQVFLYIPSSALDLIP